MVNEIPEIPPSNPKYRRCDAFEVMREIKAQMQLCTRAWIGLGEGKFLILKDDSKGLLTYFVYDDGCFTFYDQRGGSQKVPIEEITEIAGF